MKKVKYEAVSAKNLEKHKKLTFWLVEKRNMSMEEAYIVASKLIK